MKAYHNSVVLRNDGIDPSSLKADLNAGITVPVTVRINATQALATIFDLDEVGTSNPLTTSNNGNYAFKAADNVYDIIISEGTANEVVLEKVEISEFIPQVLPALVTPFDALDEPVISTDLTVMFDGAASNIKERTTGNGGGAMWDVVLASSVTPNTFNIVQCTGVPTLALVLRDTGSLTVEAFGAGTADDTALFNFFVGKTYAPIADNEYNVTAIPSDISMFRGYGNLLITGGEKIPLGEDFKQKTINAVRPIPDTDLSWVPFFPKVDSVGNITTTEGVQHYAIRRELPVSSGDFYIDPVNGSDSNGGSPGLPLETLDEFLRQTVGANRGYMMGSDDPDNPVTFAKSDFRDTDPRGNRLKILTVQGHCRIAEPVDDLSALTWTNEPATSVYKATTTSIELNQLRYTKALDVDGGLLKIPKIPFNTNLADTIQDVDASLFGWYHDIGTNALYVRIGSDTGTTFRNFIKPLASTTASKMLFLGTAILFYCPKGSSLSFDGVYLSPLVSGSTRARLYLHAEEPNGIEIKNTFGHGIDALGSEYYCEHVKATSTGGDNFHGFDSGGISTLAMEINCDSSYAGDFNTRGAAAAGTDNGSAMHGTGHVARFGGKYYKNYGPDVVDSGSGAFWNCGVEAFGSTSPNNEIGFDITAGVGRMYLDTCLARDEDLDEIQVNAGAVLRTFNTTGEVNEVSTGVEIAYDPLSPL